MLLEVAISTINQGLYNIRLQEGVEYLIVHQVTDGREREYQKYTECSFFESSVRYMQSAESGLSVSRNLALSLSQADYIWIMDDDTQLNLTAMRSIRAMLSKHQPDILTLEHSKEPCVYGVHLSPTTIVKGHSYVSALSVSSIDMIVSSKLVIRFDESFGLGARYVSGEEYIFLLDALNKGLRAVKSEVIGSIHIGPSSGAFFYRSDLSIESKFVMFDRAHLKLSWLWSLAFIIKKSLLLFKHSRLGPALSLYLKHYLLSWRK
ncbi:glycosyltransferase family 2 protein [Vibrio maerlii]|uniref:glycosyltransferase family 2 protein n=1 Tax=Vibrio maerlii TaxID=2231648 RepID=UPI000E3C3282|nr:glycosyltransferase family 2 protein [Vibrio maerlii]